MINTAPTPSWHAADCGAPDPRDASPPRIPAPQPHPMPLEPLQRTRPPAAREAGTGGPHARLPADLVRRIAKGLPLADAARYAKVNTTTRLALAELLASQMSELQVRQQQLATQMQQAATPEALLAVVQQIPALPVQFQAEPLEAAGHRLGRVKTQPPGDADAAVFHAVWQATIALPERLRPKPLFAIAGQVAALPEPDRLPALENVLAQMQPFRNDPAHHGTLKAWVGRLVRALPRGKRAAGLRRLLDEARHLPYPVRIGIAQHQQRFERAMGLSGKEVDEVRAARVALQIDTRRPVVFRFPAAASASARRPA